MGGFLMYYIFEMVMLLDRMVGCPIDKADT